MTIQYKILLIFLVLLVNTLISLGYFLVGFIITRKNKEKKTEKIHNPFNIYVSLPSCRPNAFRMRGSPV